MQYTLDCCCMYESINIDILTVNVVYISFGIPNYLIYFLSFKKYIINTIIRLSERLKAKIIPMTNLPRFPKFLSFEP